MGGGDLNMKKSWHPGLIKNRAQVWEDQNAALQERKRIEALKKEIAEERAANELQKLNEANGGAKRQERVEFMYAGPGAGSGIAADREAYLLGRKRIDDVLGKDNLGSSADAKTNASDPGAPNMRDVSNKVALDPLLAIKKQEAAQYKALVDRKKAEMEAEARKNARRAVERSRTDDHKYRRSSRRDEDDRRHRRRSPSRERYYESRRSEKGDRYSRRDRSSERHSRSSRRSLHDRRRSPSASSTSSVDRRRSRYDDKKEMRDSRRYNRSRSRSTNRAKQQDDRRARDSQEAPRVSHDQAPLDAAAKLAAMTESAKELDDTRTRRLEEARIRDEADKMIEEAGRARHSMTNSGFMRNANLGETTVR